MSQDKVAKAQVFCRFVQWVNQYRNRTHHSKWVGGTRNQYILDAHRILLTDECLPGPGYRTVWKYITNMERQAKAQFGASVELRFQKRKGDCPDKVRKHGKA